MLFFLFVATFRWGKLFALALSCFWRLPILDLPLYTAVGCTFISPRAFPTKTVTKLWKANFRWYDEDFLYRDMKFKIDFWNSSSPCWIFLKHLQHLYLASKFHLHNRQSQSPSECPSYHLWRTDFLYPVDKDSLNCGCYHNNGYLKFLWLQFKRFFVFLLDHLSVKSSEMSWFR